METLTILGSALGLAALSGINLYATVAITGLAVKLGWVGLPVELAGLDVLSSWWVIGLAAGMYLVEFVADKWPWLDNIWDLVHTFIRPPAASLVALAATSGTSDPVIQVVAVLLAGGIALGTHATKATTRLAMNATKPPGENGSNVVVSLAEDALVAGAVLFVITHPILTLAILSVLSVLAVWLAPKMMRLLAIQARSAVHTARYLWNRRMPIRWPAPPRRTLGKVDPSSILVTLPCASLKVRKIGRYRNGYLVLTDRREVIFLTRKWFRAVERRLTNVEIESIDLRLGRLFRTLTLNTVSGKLSFKLYRNDPEWLESQVERMRDEMNVMLSVKKPGRSWVATGWERMKGALESWGEPAMEVY
jgi:hypothetical protein